MAGKIFYYISMLFKAMFFVCMIIVVCFGMAYIAWRNPGAFESMEEKEAAWE